MTIEKLTRERAIEEHRKMWNWIADETEKRNDIVTKGDYFKEHPEARIEGFIPKCGCWCCEYSYHHGMTCFRSCPILWSSDSIFVTCTYYQSPYIKFKDSIMFYNIEGSIKYARQIANLPERKFKECIDIGIKDQLWNLII